MLPDSAIVVSKGMQADEDAYSAFDARDADGCSLEASLRDYGITRVFVGGLTTEYCVKETVLDAIQRDFHAFLLEDAVRGVETHPGDSSRAIEQMVASGARKLTFEELENEFLTLNSAKE